MKRAFLKELLQKFGDSSVSCGAFRPGELLYVTGHDAKEIYVIEMFFVFALKGRTNKWRTIGRDVVYRPVRAEIVL